MTYDEFLNSLNKHKLTPKDIAEALGYGKYSFKNNWDNDENLPEKAEIAIKLFLDLKEEKLKTIELEERLKVQNKNSILSTNLSDTALKIAQKKCSENNIKLEDYLSSLVLAAI